MSAVFLLAVIKLAAPLGSIRAPESLSTPDTWSAQVRYKVATKICGSIHEFFFFFSSFAAMCVLVCGGSLCFFRVIDLPRGWEEGFTDEGASYFIKWESHVIPLLHMLHVAFFKVLFLSCSFPWVCSQKTLDTPTGLKKAALHVESQDVYMRNKQQISDSLQVILFRERHYFGGYKVYFL